ncbi:MAG TPA: hypothetical protein VMU07_03385 [Candidatus Paceibacterota bacterium]|nr:hypothetical protein [Candidatus Paceibacterota bacterium]
MADEKKNGSKIMRGGQQCVCGCDGSGMGCACGWHHGHSIFRILLGVILLVIVFWFGVRLGELRAEIRGGYGYNAYYGYGDYPMPMMHYYSNTQGAPAGTSTATK